MPWYVARAAAQETFGEAILVPRVALGGAAAAIGRGGLLIASDATNDEIERDCADLLLASAFVLRKALRTTPPPSSRPAAA